MPIITKITQQKNDKERYNIFLDDAYAFSVHEKTLVKTGLTKGMPLDQWQQEDLEFEEEVERAFNRALHYLGTRMRSEQEVRQKLLDKEFKEAAIQEAVLKLKKLGFLDDQAFSEALAKTRKKDSEKGPVAIQQELEKKGVAPEVQETVLEAYDPAEQLATATRLAEKAAKKHSSVAPAQLKQRIQNALMRKGFPYGIIKEALDSVQFEPDEDEWTAITETAGEKAWRRISGKYQGYERKMRVKQALYQKGIPFDRIDAFIEKKESEENGE